MLVPLGKEKIVLYSEIAGAVTDLILNALLIPVLETSGAAIGTLGLAAGVATGDLSNAVKYAGLGALAGYHGANRVGNKVTNFEKKSREAFREGALGTKEYNIRKSLSELNNDKDFTKVCKQFGINNKEDREELVREFNSNGITKTEDIKKAMVAGATVNASATNPRDRVNRDQIIAAAKTKQTATLNEMKRKDIIASLRSNGARGNEVKKAMNLIDRL